MQPRVGIIVPCFNQGRFAAECVNSIRAQTFGDWKAVLVDDASTDDSAELLQALEGDRVRVVRLSSNLGRALVRNEAVRQLGQVEYILNVDCDDSLSSDYLSRLVAALDANPRAGLAYGTLYFFGQPHPGGKESWPERPLVREERYLENVIPGPGVLFRAQALAATRGWRAEFTRSSGEDWDIWLQVINAGWEAEWVRHARYHYRQHTSSFLAGSTVDTQVDVLLNVLALHAAAIRASCGTRAFLAPQVMPALLGALHRHDWRRARRILAVLLRHAPSAALLLAARHYAARIRAMLRR